MDARRGTPRCRAGLSAVEVIVVLVVLGTLAAVCLPFIQQTRESARRQECRHHLRRLVQAAHAYHDAYAMLPPAAVWTTNATISLALHRSKRVDLITQENWAILLLPFIGEDSLARAFAAGEAIGAPANSGVRTARLELMTCPSDSWNRPDNPHRFCPDAPADACIDFARGNYALNGGSHNAQLDPPDTASPKGDTVHLAMREQPRTYALWGNGIGGINRSFSFDEFGNGQSTLVAFEELRAGVHPLDPRGVWSLGQIGGSITWGHGVNGDAYGPNDPWVRADDVLGCARLHEAVGADTLIAEGMPCVDYVDVNQQSASRSLHEGGVHTAFLDGSVRFISDQVDPGLWHVMHSRETPSSVLSDRFDEHLAITDFSDEATPPALRGPAMQAGEDVVNSIGMRFVVVPAGEFVMGLPDAGNDDDPPPECPAHRVRITRPFLLGTHEVTRQEFQEVMGLLPAGSPDSVAPETGGERRLERLPVVHVTWDEAVEFCRRLSERSEERQAGRTYRLPSEAEWEYACRCGLSEPYVWKPSRAPGDQSGEAAGILPPLPITPIGSYPPNEFGLFDMRGNVWEWTQDWFDRDYYLRSPEDDPRGPAQGYVKVVRGGDWRFVGEVCRIDYPVMPPWKANPFVGFRVVCEPSAHVPAAANSPEKAHDGSP